MASMDEALRTRLFRLGQRIAEREAPQVEALAQARVRAQELHRAVAAGLKSFCDALQASGDGGLKQLADIELGAPRLDQKHVRAIEFELRRGRVCAIVTVKSRAEVALVGPFRSGKAEGPCKRFPFAAKAEIETALADFLEAFLEEAMTP